MTPLSEYSQGALSDDSDSDVWFDALENPKSEFKAISSAADLQKFLREPSERDEHGLATLPRPPSSKTLSSLVISCTKKEDDGQDKKKRITYVEQLLVLVDRFTPIFTSKINRGTVTIAVALCVVLILARRR